MIGISKETYTDIATNETTGQVYLRLYVSAFSSGLMAELKPTNSMVLLALCSFMDEDGTCFPTQEQIAERIGVSKPTVNKAINDLLEFKINGKPVLSRELVQTGRFKNSVYTVNPVSQVAIFEGKIETVEITSKEGKEAIGVSTGTDNSTGFKTAKDVGNYYIEVFREVYGVAPNINYARDYSQVKKKWIGAFTDEQIKIMIETGVKEYDARWKGPKFPRPTLSALVSWIGEQALGLVEDNKKDFEESSEMTRDYVTTNEKALNRLANRLKK